MNDLISVTYDNDRPTISGRELHEKLGIKTAYKDWFPRMCEYGFKEGADFNTVETLRNVKEGGRIVSRNIIDHIISLNMANQICLVTKNENACVCREYFAKVFSKLKKSRKFEDFFVIASNEKIKGNRSELRDLLLAIECFFTEFNPEAISLLCDTIQAEMVLPCKNPISRTYTEKEYQKMIVDNFENYFPDYLFCGSEVVIEGIGRIDILAKHKTLGSDTIIELKIKNRNPTPQLLAYSHYFNNPILIGISEDNVNNKTTGIEYFTYKELGII